MTMAAGGGDGGSEGTGRLPSENPFLARAGLELAYFSGYSRLMQRRAGGAGVILRLEASGGPRAHAFEPHNDSGAAGAPLHQP